MAEYLNSRVVATTAELTKHFGQKPTRRIEQVCDGEWRLEEGNLQSGTFRFYKLKD